MLRIEQQAVVDADDLMEEMVQEAARQSAELGKADPSAELNEMVGIGATDALEKINEAGKSSLTLGLQANPTVTLESVVKSDQLINVLNQMLSIMNDIINNPSEVNCITEEITLLSQQLNKIKSQTTKAY